MGPNALKEKQLSSKQEKALLVLLEGLTVPQTAEKVDVCAQTIYRWLRNEDFQADSIDEGTGSGDTIGSLPSFPRRRRRRHHKLREKARATNLSASFRQDKDNKEPGGAVILPVKGVAWVLPNVVRRPSRPILQS